MGNFPQAFTHLALISAAFNLDRALGTLYSGKLLRSIEGTDFGYRARPLADSGSS